MIEILVEELEESTAEYAKSLEKIARDKQLKMLSKSEKQNLLKIAALLDKERKEEVEIDENPHAVAAAMRDIEKRKQAKKDKKKDQKEENGEGNTTASAGIPQDTKNMGPKRKRKCETFKVSDDCYHRFRNGKTKFERWSKYLDLGDESQKKIYDFARKHHRGNIILQNATTGQVRGIRFNRTGGGQWGNIQRVKEQFLRNNDEFSQLDEDVLDILRNIVKNKQMQKVKFKDKKTASVDGFTASAMVQVYDAINKDNQSKFREMINKNLKGFMAMQSFAMKSVK